MLRSAIPFAFALVCSLPAGAARAQDASDLVTRVDRLEQTIRDLTGQVEQLQYRNQQLEQQVQRLQGQTPGGAGPSASATPQNPPTSSQYTVVPQYSQPPAPQYSPPPQAQYSAPQTQYSPPPAPVIASAPAAAPIASDGTPGHDAFNPALHPNAPGAPRALGSSTDATEPPPPAPDVSAPPQPGAPLNLSNMSIPAGGPSDNATQGGALPPPPAVNPSSTGVTQQAALPSTGTPKDEYDLGYGYIQQKNYSLAEDTFHDFLRKYPSDRLTPEAQYWLGEALFQDQKYRDAAESFLAVSTKYESTARAPDALLRLGESLAALGEKEAACASLGEVLRKYPHASANVKQSVDREQKRVHC